MTRDFDEAMPGGSTDGGLFLRWWLEGSKRGWPFTALFVATAVIATTAILAVETWSAAFLVLLLPLFFVPAVLRPIQWMTCLAVFSLALGLLVVVRQAPPGIQLGFVVLIGVMAAHSMLLTRVSRSAREMHLRIQEQAMTDGLSGVLTRAAFDLHLAHEVGRSVRYEEPLSMLVCDIDRLKQRNDDHGHPAGDEAITHLGNALKSATRGCDVIGRIGGDEFAVLLPRADLASAAIVANRIEAALEAAPLDQGSVSVSIGAAQRRTEDPRTLYAEADRSLYVAKRSRHTEVRSAS